MNIYKCFFAFFLCCSDGKESACIAGVRSLGQEVPLRREWQPTPVFLPGEFHGLRSLAGYNPWGHKELDMTERLTQTHRHTHTHTHTHGSCTFAPPSGNETFLLFPACVRGHWSLQPQLSPTFTVGRGSLLAVVSVEATRGAIKRSNLLPSQAG